MVGGAILSYGELALDLRTSSNVDMLAWFTEAERFACLSCGDQACVTLPDAIVSFCLSCGAVTIDGVRIDADRHVAVDRLRTSRAAAES